MRTSITLLASALVIASLGCSSSSDGAPVTTDTGAGTDTAVASDTSTPSESGADTATEDAPAEVSDDTAATKPATPTLSSVEKMSGSLHVSWKLNDTGLTNVYVFRKKDGGAYAKAYTLPGTATSQHDMGASTAGSTYCYQVQTVKAGAMSDLSNEMCGSP